MDYVKQFREIKIACEVITGLIFTFYMFFYGNMFSDIGANQHILKSDDARIHNSPGIKISQSEEKLSKMEEVVEKVVELYVENSWEKYQDGSTKPEDMTVTTHKENKETSVTDSEPSQIEENETDESK